ncbi:nucleoporin Nup43-like [Clavelina lepadiformis]|uniref:nucleoporin Nup43-like n=1 Tax=Clavelina lepadiformis TaxID=159417 RepID=UPI00404206A9
MAECLTYVSQKIHKIRWKPTSTTIQKSETFATGSYEDLANSITIWGVGHMTGVVNQDKFEVADLENSQPRRQCCCKIPGDVNGMEFANSEIIVAGLSSGAIYLVRLESQSQELNVQFNWENLHPYGGSTDIAANLPEIVSVGEDGSIHVMRIDSKRPLRTFAHSDSCPITQVQYLNTHELCTTNTVGQLRIWDVRSPTDASTRVMSSSETLVALRCVDQHPTQSYILASGGSDGCVTLFDIRKECSPLTKLQIHDEDIWELRFHRTSPSYIFSCSEDGSVRRLNSSFEMKALSLGGSNIDVSELVPKCGSSMNSLDVSGTRMLCATDAESVYVIDDVI